MHRTLLQILPCTLILALSFAFQVRASFTHIPTNTASLRALNKQTGRKMDIEIPVGRNHIFETLLVDVRVCYTRPEYETPENSAFVQITESNTHFREELRTVRSGNQVFSGWLFSSSPSLSALDHPHYDIWLLECKNDPNLPTPEPVTRSVE